MHDEHDDDGSQPVQYIVTMGSMGAFGDNDSGGDVIVYDELMALCKARRGAVVATPTEGNEHGDGGKEDGHEGEG